VADQDEIQPWVEGEPAFLLDEGIAYVRAWARAQHAATAIRDALADLGRPDAMPHLRADVNEFGNGLVELGRVTPETAVLIARALHKIGHVPDQASGSHAA
jgi:hypothetical protein